MQVGLCGARKRDLVWSALKEMRSSQRGKKYQDLLGWQNIASIQGEGVREVKLGHLSLGKKEAVSEKEVLGVGNEMIINAQHIMGQLSRTVLEFQGN